MIAKLEGTGLWDLIREELEKKGIDVDASAC